MPIPKPNKDESQQDFVSRCIKFVIDEGTADNTPDGRKQAAAICFNTWRDAKGKKQISVTSVKQNDMKPQNDEEHQAWMNRCTGSGKNPKECQDIWDENMGEYKSLKRKQEPQAEEDFGDWMDRCTGDLNMDSDTCQDIWDRWNFPAGIGDEGDQEVFSAAKKNGIVLKTHADTDSSGMEFVLSDATPDRFGDVVEQNWELTNFKRNPIALFNHNKDFIVGKWVNLGVKNAELRGYLQLAPKGASARIDEIRALVDAKILRAVSVGFRPLESKPLENKPKSDSPLAELLGMGGMRYIKNELVETSLVAVPANPNALAVAKSLGVSDDTLKLIFAKHGKKKIVEVSRGITGENAEHHTKKERRGNMQPLAQRIKDAEVRVVKLKDQLTEHVSKIDDENPDETSSAITEELSAKIDQQETLLNNLKRAEQHVMAGVERQIIPQPEPAPAPVSKAITHFGNGGSSALDVSSRPFAVPGKKITPMDYLIRSVLVLFKHHVEKGRRSMDQIMVQEYGEDVTTKGVMDYVTRAAAPPATTTGSGWVDTLIQTAVGDLVAALTAQSIFPKLAGAGTTYTFDRNAGKIVLPIRTAGNLGGGFVAEGSPIPVKAGAFTAVTLTPKKLGVITTMTRQAANYSTQALEGILRDGILQDTAVALDTILMDNNAASTTRPQGFQNAGGASKTPTAGGAIAGLIGDLKLLVSSLITNTAGNIRKPVWIISPGDVLVMSLTQAAAGGTLPFRDELAGGTLLGYPVIQSTTGTSDTMYLIDAADFATSVGAPQFDVSDQAVLHMEDTSPQPLAQGTGPTVATPIRSLYQTDSMAIRLLWDLDWAWRRQNMVVWVTGMTWN